MELFNDMVFWHWFVIAIVLITIEIFTGSMFVFFVAVAAAIVGVMAWVAPDMPWTAEFIIWSVLSLASVIGWHYYRKAHPPEDTDQPSLNRRGSQYVGRVFTLDEPIVNGVGKIKVDDSTWKVVSESDMKKGDKVKVSALDGVVLKVEKA
ncbi:MAG: NfeD family protein [Alphaproteobacteria bacterium]|nr:NfeD family protein [Alphaproteobacteria bacterium]NCQ87566.1 NfeD family protein [Alphaproteobacteria bacterium]NCT06435.1 NfeD family protein [Alphaproteobacteria bacterium]